MDPTSGSYCIFEEVSTWKCDQHDEIHLKDPSISPDSQPMV